MMKLARWRSALAMMFLLVASVTIGQPPANEKPLKPTDNAAAVKQLATFRVPDGFKVELFAAEPLSSFRSDSFSGRRRVVRRREKCGSAARRKWLRHGGKREQVSAPQIGRSAVFQNLTQNSRSQSSSNLARQRLRPTIRERFTQRISRSPRPFFKGRGAGGEGQSHTCLSLQSPLAPTPLSRQEVPGRGEQMVSRLRPFSKLDTDFAKPDSHKPAPAAHIHLSHQMKRTHCLRSGFHIKDDD